MNLALNLEHEKDVASQIALEAGKLIRHYRQEGFEVEEKSHNNPVTIADREASDLSIQHLFEMFPSDGILSEEVADNNVRLRKSRVWIIDPIDGTREFINGTDDYVFSLGLVIDQKPVLGVIYAPERDDLYVGVVGDGMYKNGERVGFSDRETKDLIISVSDTEYKHTLSKYPTLEMAPSGSIAYKLARVASGETDLTFTIAPRSEWDIAAGAAMLEAQGGMVATRDGTRILYNQPKPYLERGLIAGRPDNVAWLQHQLAHFKIPEKRMWVTPQSDAWSMVPPSLQISDKDHHVHLLVNSGGLESAVLLERTIGGWKVVQQVGENRRFIVDLQRDYGAFI
jgi:myo-inositol-1(or 4)-monophosphatase